MADLELPSWAEEMLRRRRPAQASTDDPVFTAPRGGLRDPSNTSADLREAFNSAGCLGDQPRLSQDGGHADGPPWSVPAADCCAAPGGWRPLGFTGVRPPRLPI